MSLGVPLPQDKFHFFERLPEAGKGEGLVLDAMEMVRSNWALLTPTMNSSPARTSAARFCAGRQETCRIVENLLDGVVVLRIREGSWAQAARGELAQKGFPRSDPRFAQRNGGRAASMGYVWRPRPMPCPQ